jgi:hypothetical protein
MIDPEYLKLGKEEIKSFMELMDNFNENNFSNILNRMEKALLFMIDSIMGKHSDLLTEYSEIKEKVGHYFGQDFFETYYAVSGLAKKKAKFVGNSNIIIIGKKPYNLDLKYFNELSHKIVKYFNTLYSRVEDNGF